MSKENQLSPIEIKELFNGVERITVNYAGGGDSGCIEEVNIFGPGDTEIKGHKTLKDHIEERCYDVLNDLPDWVNNDGGRGDIDINIKNNKMDISHTTYDTNSDSDSKTDVPLADKVKTKLKALPEKVIKLLFESDNSSEHVVCLDRLGRRVLIDNKLDNQLCEVLRELGNDTVRIADDAQEESEQFEIVVDRKAGTVNVNVRWSVQTSNDDMYYVPFFPDEEMIDE